MKTSTRLFREVFGVYLVVLVAVIVAALIANYISFVATILYAVVAFIFIGAGQRAMDRSSEPPEAFGVSGKDRVKGVIWGLVATVVTLPFFAVGFWAWESIVNDRDFDPGWHRYLHWDAELEGEPQNWGADRAGVWVWSNRDKLFVGMRNHDRSNSRVVLEAEEPFVPEYRGTLVLKSLEGRPSHEASKRWSVALTHAKSRGLLTLEQPRGLELKVEPVVAGHEPWPLYLGPQKERADSTSIDLGRTIWWIPLWVLTQLLLIAFPEEFFYRGYVQSRLQQAFEARAVESESAAAEVAGMTPAIVLTSVLFGLGHLLVPVGGALVATRMSVFFPSLVFGWLRRFTGGLSASIVYHAACNLMVLFATVHLA